jgi:hypothetical protein
MEEEEIICTKPGCNCQRTKSIKRILKENENDMIINSFNLIMSILRNIKKFPNEEKYRKIKSTNSKVQDYIMKIKGALGLLYFVGFKLEEESLFLETPDEEGKQKIEKLIEMIERTIDQVFGETKDKTKEELTNQRNMKEVERKKKEDKKKKEKEEREEILRKFEENKSENSKKFVSKGSKAQKMKYDGGSCILEFKRQGG